MNLKYKLIAMIFVFCSLFIIDNVNALSMGRATNKEGVSVRTGPSSSYSRTAILYYNDVVPLISTTKEPATSDCPGGWYKINHNGLVRYACSNYLSTSNTTLKANASKGLNARLGPGTDYGVYTVFDNNSTLTLQYVDKYTGDGCSAGWYRLHYNHSTDRYVCSSYVDQYNNKSNAIVTWLGGAVVRKSPDKSSTGIVSLKYGQPITLVETTKYKGDGCDGGWYKVFYKGYHRYICSTSVLPSRVNGTVNNISGVNVRSGPATTYKKTTNLKFNANVTLVDTTKYKGSGCSAGWYKIKLNDSYRYVCSSYISTSSLATTISNSVSVNIRDDHTTDSTVVTTLKPDTNIILDSTTKYQGSGCSAGWYKIKLNTKDYYVCSSYTKLGKTSSSSTTTSKTVTKKTTSDEKTYYTTNKWTYKINENYATVRNSAGGTVKDYIFLGTEIKPISTSGSYTKISYYNGRTGYILTRLIDKYSSITKTNTSYCNQLKAKGFPESYCPYLSYLHAKYPNWVFKAEKTGISFSDAIDGESRKNYNQIDEDEYIYSWTIQESGDSIGDYRTSSDAFNAYMLDPRNYLNEKNIYVFEDLSYDSVNQTKSVVRSIVDGSYLDTDTYAGYFVNAGKTYNVSPVHLAARVKQEGGTNSSYTGVSGKVTTKWNVTNSGYVCSSSSYGTKSGSYFKIKSGVSLNVRKGAGTNYSNITYANGKYMTVNSNDDVILQSTTKYTGDGCSSGWYKVKVNKSLKGIYNYYNIGAYGKNPVVRGLAAAAGYVDDLDGTPWNTRQKAITYGAKFIANGYINAGQDTMYYQKFNTAPGAKYSPFTHQYMTNIIAPASESLSTYYSYNKLNITSKALVFNIPVYDNMPTTPTSHPPVGSITAHINALK